MRRCRAERTEWTIARLGGVAEWSKAAVLKTDPLSAQGCTDAKTPQIWASGTQVPAPEGTEWHRDQGGDQGRDHGGGLGLGELAERLLAAVAEGSMSSFELARSLAAAVVELAIVRRAQALDGLLKEGSPFALVRAGGRRPARPAVHTERHHARRDRACGVSCP
jgi:hypothetical protein